MEDKQEHMDMLLVKQTDKDVFVDSVYAERTEESKNGEHTRVKERETWTHSIEFLLSLLGYTVGMANFWRFPYLCMKNGGGAFLIPFLVCLLTCGVPLFFLEVALGQFLGRSSLHAWVVCPLFKGIGIGMILVCAVFSLYHNMILAWALYYLANSFTSTLPWTTCEGWWNTDNCFVQSESRQYINESAGETVANVSSSETYSVVNTSVPGRRHNNSMSSEEEFWQYNVLQISTGLGDFGSIPWHLVVSLLCAWIIVYGCIIKGVRSIGKVIYVTALLPYVLLTVLLIKGMTLDGSVDGIIYYLRPDVTKMMTTQVWVEAAMQVFFSLGAAWGPIITMASYNKFSNNCLRDAFLVCFVGEGTSIFSGFVIFSILGFISHELNLPIQDVVKSGPGLGFVAYPQALSLLPIPQLWSVLFFLMLVALGLDGQFSSVESVIAGVIDMFPHLRKRRALVSLFACAIGFLVGILFCFQGGMFIFQLIDWYVAILAVPVFGLIECVIFAWIYGAERFCQDIKLMLGSDVPVIIRLCWCVITPAVLVCCLIFSLITYVPPTYGDYKYPPYAQIIGWFVAALSVIPVAMVAMTTLITRGDNTIMQALVTSLSPSAEWKPQSRELQGTYNENKFSYKDVSCLGRIKINIFGNWFQ